MTVHDLLPWLPDHISPDITYVNMSTSTVQKKLMVTGLGKQAPMTSTLSDLPNEVLLKIFRYVAQDAGGEIWSYLPSEPNKAAHNLCLIAKRFHKIAREMMFNNVVIQQGDDVYSQMWQHFFNSDELATKCRKLTLNCDFMDDVDAPFNYDRAYPLRYIASKLPRLECIDVHTNVDAWNGTRLGNFFDLSWTLDPKQDRFVHITTLIYHELDDEDLEIMVNVFPSLKRLLIRNWMDMRRTSFLEDHAGTGPLEELHIGTLVGHHDDLARLFA